MMKGNPAMLWRQMLHPQADAVKCCGIRVHEGTIKATPQSEQDDWKCFNINMWVGVVYTLLDAYPYM